MIDCVKVQPHLFVSNLATIGAFLALLGPFRNYFWSLGKVVGLFAGSDGFVRSAEVLRGDGQLQTSPQTLVPSKIDLHR